MLGKCEVAVMVASVVVVLEGLELVMVAAVVAVLALLRRLLVDGDVVVVVVAAVR